MAADKRFETDVLVIGGGMAGLFAAIKAKGQGADVILVDKGYAGKSGSTPYAFWYALFNPAWGHDLAAWTNYVSSVGEYLNNREWTEIVFKESAARFEDLVSWGVEFVRDENGELQRFKFPGIVTESIQLRTRVFGDAIRRQAKRAGVKILDRVMITDLLQQSGRIVGAAGFAMETGDFHVFRSRAVVMCTGGSSFKPDGWPVSELTGDGDAMAYRAGAAISGKEFNEPKSTNVAFPAATMGMTLWMAERDGISVTGHKPPQVNTVKCVNAEGEEIIGLPGANCLELEFEAHAGRAPVYQNMGPEGSARDDDYPFGHKGLSRRVGGAASGLSVHTADGLWPVNTNCATTLPGLFAAGDACCTMEVGAVYPGVGEAILGAVVTGARAGLGAAEYARTVETLDIAQQEIEEVRERLFAPMKRRGGFSPRWVTQVLRNTVIPYFVLYVKHEERMKAVLTLVEFMRDHLVPKLKAGDAHELRLAVEAKNMIHNAEMKLRASLFRQESRGTHYREDYPRRDDADWLAWAILERGDGCMRLSKKPVPREWWPDLSKPYEERYPKRLPGE
jgi:succinate dehydrogenase/fumarate reductase flavoprotein subunit